MSDAKEIYDRFVLEAQYPWCWSCGRSVVLGRPRWWAGPWIVERAHIVNKPRREDRRAVILLCSLCHRLEHGEYLGPGRLPIRVTLAEMLWLKSRFDPEYYDRKFLQANAVGKLPRARRPRPAIEDEYRRLRGGYPSG